MVCLLFFAVGCQPDAPEAESIIIPTVARLDATPTPNLIDAERVARQFLEAWRESDLEVMHSLISFSSQEAQPLPEFIALYEQAHATMTYETLDYRGNTLTRNGDVAVFNYDVTFQTRILGNFTDAGRDMLLVFDERANDWRVAWTAGDIFREMADGSQLRMTPIIPPRANIYDRGGLLTLADQNGRVAVVNVIREKIPDYAGCLSALSVALEKPVEELQARLEARPAHWLMDMGTLDATGYEAWHEQLEAICAAQFDGRPVRHYSSGAITANIVGYVGYPDEEEVAALEAAGFQADSIIGRSGIEASWDEALRGQPGGTLSVVTPGGQVLREIVSKRSEPPHSVWLTIDTEFQRRIYQIFEQAYAENAESWAAGSRGASAVVMDVNTGEVLAMVSYPSFDNNAFTPFPIMGQQQAQQIIAQVQQDPRRPQLNRPLLGAYPLGSVMKLVSSIAAAESRTYSLDERYTCTGIWSRDITRYDWLAGGHGTVTLPQAITRSCNPYYYEVGYRLDAVDPYLLPNTARMMGFGSATGIEGLPEADGLIVDPDWWRQNIGSTWNFSEAVNMAIGQGYLQVTPVQVTRMIAAIANGGRLLQPQLVLQAGLYGEPPSYEAQPVIVREVDVRPEVMAMVRQGMCDVTTTPLGTAEFIFRDSPVQTYGVCGKTGTAQPGTPNVMTHAWFAAYAPRENPEIAVVVMVENGNEGSGTAAPIARDIFEVYFTEGVRERVYGTQ